MNRPLVALMLAAVLSLLLASTAMAATRYAAPGGTGKDPCANPERPCSVYTAAADGAPRTTIEAGDVVELAPGTYYAKEEGEFGYIPPVPLPEGVTLRGEPGKPRPVIVMPTDSFADSAFYVPEGAEVANVEIRNLMETARALNISGGTINGVIARSTITSEPTCSFSWGIVRNSACIATGGGSAIRINAGVIRDSTLVAAGLGSIGMEFNSQASKRGMTVKLDVVGGLISGEEKDVVAKGRPLDNGRGGRVGIDLSSSGYARVKTEGRVSVTPPGSNGNIRATPWLAGDNLHQLPGSPTIDQGAVDGTGGGLDVDGQPRAMGAGVDIGVDELDPLAAPLVNAAPNTKFVDHVIPLGAGSGNPTFFTFGSSGVGSHFECKFDRRRYQVCASPFLRKVGPGEHALRVRAVDPQGLADPTPATYRWRVQPR